MKVITIESSAYKTMMEQIAEIAGYIRELKEERQRQETETKDRLLDTAQTAELLNVSAPLPLMSSASLEVLRFCGHIPMYF